jgi:Domain of unknown function (DUF1814).
MIDKATYELEWIHAVSQQLGKRGDPKIVEKVIHAFTLLEQLKLSGLVFIFKGGTSLLLLSQQPRRFSIDIDIITSVKPEEMPAYLDKVVGMGSFSKWVDDNERKHVVDAPIGHYKFYYASKIGSRFGEEPVLLDVLFIENPYPKLIDAPISHRWLKTTGDLSMVNIPAVESIAGDKLTAFAPTTTGILYDKDRPVEIIKQLYDIAFLFDESVDFTLLRESYINVANEEIKYRKLSITWEHSLDDAFQTARIITERDVKNERFMHLNKGISNIINFILARFYIEEAIVCAAKVAYLTRVIRANQSAVERFSHASQVQSLTIEHPQYGKFNKLKKSSPEAFFYWCQAVQNTGFNIEGPNDW